MKHLDNEMIVCNIRRLYMYVIVWILVINTGYKDKANCMISNNKVLSNVLI